MKIFAGTQADIAVKSISTNNYEHRLKIAPSIRHV